MARLHESAAARADANNPLAKEMGVEGVAAWTSQHDRYGVQGVDRQKRLRGSFGAG